MFKLEFRPYRRPYRQPFESRWGRWTERCGILIRLTDWATQTVGYGEIAPFPGFHSETYDQALTLLQDLKRCYPERLPPTAIATLPESYTATQFALGSALWQLDTQGNQTSSLPPLTTPLPIPLAQQAVSLPRGSRALEAWPAFWQAGYRTFKWKIGLADPPREIEIFKRLLAQLPPSGRVRLDANGNLTLAQAQTWIKASNPQQVEFLEQPLPPEHTDDLKKLAQDSPLPLALDEAVSTLQDLSTWAEDWPGIFVLKAPLMGCPQKLHQFLNNHPLDIVFSAVFETGIARKIVLNLAQSFQNPQRALGLATQTWLDPNDGFEIPDASVIWGKSITN